MNIIFFPVFITRLVKFSQLGRHLEGLAERLPRHMLRVAIQDMRSGQARMQWELDSVWMILAGRIWDAFL